MFDRQGTAGRCRCFVWGVEGRPGQGRQYTATHPLHRCLHAAFPFYLYMNNEHSNAYSIEANIEHEYVQKNVQVSMPQSHDPRLHTDVSNTGDGPAVGGGAGGSGRIRMTGI